MHIYGKVVNNGLDFILFFFLFYFILVFIFIILDLDKGVWLQNYLTNIYLVYLHYEVQENKSQQIQLELLWQDW